MVPKQSRNNRSLIMHAASKSGSWRQSFYLASITKITPVLHLALQCMAQSSLFVYKSENQNCNVCNKYKIECGEIFEPW